MGIPWKQQLPYPLVHTIYLKTIPQSTSLRTQSSLLNLVNYHLYQKTNIRDPIIITIEINLTETETMIGPLKPQEITPEVTLEGNTPKIIKTSLPTTLKIDNIIQETHQEVTPEGDPQTLNIGHIVEIKIKDINLGAHSADMTAPRIHTQLETTIDQEINLKMDHTIDPGRDSKMDHITDQEIDVEMDHSIDPERDSEMTHRKDMKIHMVKGINQKKKTLHILGKEIIAKMETTEKETHHNQEATAITGPQTIQQKKGTPHIQEEEALPETETTTELLHQALTHLQDT